MMTILIILHVTVCVFLVAIVLLQHGKGADMGATFGGSSQTIFGTEGPVPLLNKITTTSAIIFMITSLTLAYVSSQKGKETVMKEMPMTQVPQQSAPTEAQTVIPLPDGAPPEADTEPATPAFPAHGTDAGAGTPAELPQPLADQEAEATQPAIPLENKAVEAEGAEAAPELAEPRENK